MSNGKVEAPQTSSAGLKQESAGKGKPSFRNPWYWVPSLYYAEGIPYAIVMLVSIVMYKDMKISNTDITFYTGWLSLPWVIKPIWSPFVDMFRKKRFWITAMQFLIGAGLAGVALTIPAASFFQYTLAFMFLIAFSSATHDIAADGFYMLGLDKHDQAFYAGIRGTFYRIAMITAQGVLVFLAGTLSASQGVVSAYKTVFLIVTALFFLFAVYHFFMLPYPDSDKPAIAEGGHVMKNFVRTFALFFQKKKIWLVIIFLLVYRLGEAQLLSLVAPFLKDPRELGGLALTTQQVGIVSGTVGVIGLLIGGITGGILAARVGLGKSIWWMFASINTPALVYIFLSYTQPESIYLIGACIGFEQFCYGFGFTAYMLYMMYVCGDGEMKTSHYSIATGFMALSMMIPRLFAGKIEDLIGYQHFFVWAFLAVIPAFFVVRAIPYDPNFGKKSE